MAKKPPARKATKRPTARASREARTIEPKEPTSPSPDQIAARAFALWVAQGRPDGQDIENWCEAESQLVLGLS